MVIKEHGGYPKRYHVCEYGCCVIKTQFRRIYCRIFFINQIFSKREKLTKSFRSQFFESLALFYDFTLALRKKTGKKIYKQKGKLLFQFFTAKFKCLCLASSLVHFTSRYRLDVNFHGRNCKREKEKEKSKIAVFFLCRKSLRRLYFFFSLRIIKEEGGYKQKHK